MKVYAFAREMQEEEEEKREKRGGKRVEAYICEALYVPWCVSQGGGTCVSECFARMPGKREKSVRNAEGTESRRTEGGSAHNRELLEKSVSRLAAVRRHLPRR